MPTQLYEMDDMDNVTFRIDKKTLKRIDDYWRSQHFRDRTEIIRRSLVHMVEGVPCPKCGALNPKGGHICSVCLRTLDEDDEISKVFSLFLQNRELFEAFVRQSADAKK